MIILFSGIIIGLREYCVQVLHIGGGVVCHLAYKTLTLLIYYGRTQNDRTFTPSNSLLSQPKYITCTLSRTRDLDVLHRVVLCIRHRSILYLGPILYCYLCILLVSHNYYRYY